MSHGVANITTLYDADGNPVTVELVDNEYRVRTSDQRAQDSLDEIKILLVQLLDVLTKQR